jgi:hypothetical protein
MKLYEEYNLCPRMPEAGHRDLLYRVQGSLHELEHFGVEGNQAGITDLLFICILRRQRQQSFLHLQVTNKISRASSHQYITTPCAVDGGYTLRGSRG